MVITYYGNSKDKPGKVANPARGQLIRENEISLSPLRPRFQSHDTGLTIPSRVSLFISMLRLNLVLSHGIPPELRRGVHKFISTSIRHRLSPEFVGSRHCVPMAFIAVTLPVYNQ